MLLGDVGMGRGVCGLTVTMTVQDVYVRLCDDEERRSRYGASKDKLVNQC